MRMKVVALFLLPILLLLLPTDGAEAGQKQEPRKYELIGDLDHLIVVFAHAIVEGAKQGKSGNGEGGDQQMELPKDWVRIWNEAALKIVLDGAANELLATNASAKLEKPDIIVGEMDSINEDTKQFYEGRAGVQIVRVQNEHKTDLEKAIDIISGKIQSSERANTTEQEDGEEKYEGILLLGPIHGRFDSAVCTLHAMVMHTLKHPNIPIMALDGTNFLVMLPTGKTKLGLNKIEEKITGKSGLVPVRQRATKVFTKGFQWNLGKDEGNEPERQAIEFGAKLSCSNKIQSPNEFLVDTTEPVLFTFELRNPNCVL